MFADCYWIYDQEQGERSDVIGDKIEVNPFSDHPLDASELDLIVNRTEEIEQLTNRLRAAARSLRQNIAILGDDGSGKTSLLNILEAKGKLIPSVLLIRQEITENTTELTFFKGMLSSIITELEKQTGSLLITSDLKEIAKRVEGITKSKEKASELSVSIGHILLFLGFGGKFSAKETETRGPYRDISEILPSFETVVKELLSKRYKAIIVMIDEAGYAFSDKTKALLQRFRLLFQRLNLMLIVAGNLRLIEDLTSIESTFANLIPVNSRLELKGLDAKYVRSLVGNRLSKVMKEAQNKKKVEEDENDKKRKKRSQDASNQDENKASDIFSNEAADEVYRQTRGNLRDIILLCSDSINIAITQKADLVTPEHVLVASDSMVIRKGKDMLSKLKNEEEHEIVQRLHSLGRDYVRSFALTMNKPPSTISFQLARLKDLGYLDSDVSGKKVYYRPSRPLKSYLDQITEQEGA